MFGELRNKMLSKMGVKLCSFEDLERLEIESVGSVCISTTSSMSSSKSSSQTDILAVGEDELKASAHRKVRRMLKFIKSLKQLKETRTISLPIFMDLVRDKQYDHVSMGMFDQFTEAFPMKPKPIPLHYYVYFLHYACYYHSRRANADVIDPKKKNMHQRYLGFIKLQLEYVQYIIHHSPARK